MEISVREVLQAEGLVTGDPHKDDEVIRMHMKEQNCKKAEAARARYAARLLILIIDYDYGSYGRYWEWI